MSKSRSKSNESCEFIREGCWARDNLSWDACCARDNLIWESSSSLLYETYDITFANFFKSFLLVMEANWIWNSLLWTNTPWILLIF